MSFDRAAFAVTAATKADRAPASLDADTAYHALANALLAVIDHGEAVAAAIARATRIAGRLDDPTVAGTVAQRAAAEAAHWSCVQTAKRERDALRRSARAVGRLWPTAPPDARIDILTAFPRGWHDAACWDLVRADQTLAPLSPWAELIRARDAAEPGEPCPF